MARQSANDQLARVLSLVPWIAAQDEVEIDEACAHFGISRKQLEDDLNAIVVVGLYPYSPADYIDVLWNGDTPAESTHVSIGYTNFFERPLRLTLHEALALLTAGVAVQRSPGHEPDGPLARGLAKLADVVHVDVDEDIAVNLSQAESSAFAAMSRAIDDHRVVTIDYYSNARDQTTRRDVEPRRLFHSGGAAYVDAFCRLSEDDRIFRLDRIGELTVLDETFDAATVSTAGGDGDRNGPVFDPTDDVPRVTLDVPAEAGWVAETYPTDEVIERDDRLHVTLAVAATPWLERLLLRLGPDARVIDGPPDLRDAGRRAARRILDTWAR